MLDVGNIVALTPGGTGPRPSVSLGDLLRKTRPFMGTGESKTFQPPYFAGTNDTDTGAPTSMDWPVAVNRPVAGSI